MIGSLVFGTLSDKFGRRPVFLFTAFTPFVLGMFLFFIKNYVAFVVLRFFLGFILQVRLSSLAKNSKIFFQTFTLHLTLLPCNKNKHFCSNGRWRCCQQERNSILGRKKYITYSCKTQTLSDLTIWIFLTWSRHLCCGIDRKIKLQAEIEKNAQMYQRKP